MFTAFKTKLIKTGRNQSSCCAKANSEQRYLPYFQQELPPLLNLAKFWLLSQHPGIYMAF